MVSRRQESLLGQVSAMIQTHADAVAIEQGDRRLSYKQLEQKVAQLCYHLQQSAIDEANEVPVVVLCNDSWTVIPLMLALFRLGWVFIPLNPEDPSDRLRAMLHHVQAKLLLFDTASEALAKDLGRDCSCQLLGLESLLSNAYSSDSWQQNSATGLEKDPNSISYVYHSSGSTGQPKSIAGTGAGIWHFVQWERQSLFLTAGCRVSQLSRPFYDAFLRDVFTPLCCGGTVCIPARTETFLSGDKLRQWLQQSSISVLHTIPSVLRLLFPSNGGQASPLSTLRYVLLAGERLLPFDVAAWYGSGETAQLINSYGPTETVMTKVAYFVRPQDAERGTIPIGQAMDDTQVFLLDAAGQCIDDDKIGEICISPGFYLPGYYKQAELSSQVFFPYSDLIKDGNGQHATPRQVYRSGDYGRRLPSGDLEFLGRQDHQVKINGVRVELAELENHINALTAVKECVVHAREHRGRQQIICYLVADTGVDIVQTVAGHVKAGLPRILWPAYYERLTQLPRLPNGKVNYKKLPKPNYSSGKDKESAFITRLFDEAYDLTEFHLTQIWESILGRKGIKLSDNYFDLGGDSLTIFKILNAIETQLQQTLTLAEFLANPNILSLAQRLRQQSNTGAESQSTSGFHSIVVPLHRSDKGKPLWLVHAPGGNVLAYARLAKELDNHYAVYGLQYPYGQKFVDLDQLARLYAQQIQAVQAEGPYVLGGWSMGGVMAVAVAKHLLQQGEVVQSVLLIDSEMPYADAHATVSLRDSKTVAKGNAKSNSNRGNRKAYRNVETSAFVSLVKFIGEGFSVKIPSEMRYSKNLLTKLLRLMAFQLMGVRFSKAELQQLDASVFNIMDQILQVTVGTRLNWLQWLPSPLLFSIAPERQLNLVLSMMQRFKLSPHNFNLDNARDFINAFRYNLESVCRYGLQDCDVDLILFGAGDSLGNKQSAEHWQAFTSRTVDYCAIPGNHFTLLTEPHVQQLAHAMKQKLGQPVYA
ncbi:MAG: AMP-binding protein [Gammaproteobacteria bacterium]|nr:AMP-binding protein [Gammaproteobacteria bacterium]MDH5802262.1 AMP-binding protein [Gammaproteobacteria bacterium]